MALFDFEEAERELLDSKRRVTRGDTVGTLMDHRWVGMGMLLFVIGALMRNTTLMAMTGFMLVVVLISWAWSRRALQSIVYRREFQHKRVFPGEKIDLQIIVENRKLLPLGWMRVEDEWPKLFGPEDEARLNESPAADLGFLSNTYTLRWYQRVRRHIPLVAHHRGIYQIGPAFALSGDPFNLFERGHDVGKLDHLIVYPEVKPLEELGLPYKDPLGDKLVRQQLFEDPNRIAGVREHQPEDDLRHVHWTATARTGELQTKVYEPTRSVNVVFCLNVSTFESHWHGFWPEMLEYLVSTTASLAYWGASQNYAVGVVANGTLVHADQPFRVLPSSDRNQLTRILETLAGVSYIVTTDFSTFMLDESPGLPWGATMVLITAFVDDALQGTILRLRESGRRVVLVALGKEVPPAIPGVLMHHLPIDSEPPSIDLEAEDNDDMTARDRFLRERARRESAR